jgi:hypothetical protein
MKTATITYTDDRTLPPDGDILADGTIRHREAQPA